MLRIETHCDCDAFTLSAALEEMATTMDERGADFRALLSAATLDTLSAVLDPIADGCARYLGRLAEVESEELGDVAHVEEL